MIVFENLDGFVRLLDSIPEKNIPLFITKKNNIDNNMILSGSIVLQFHYGDDVVTYAYMEHITPVQLVPTDFMFKLGKAVDNPGVMGAVDAAIKAKIDMFNGQLESEYQKAIGMVRTKGFPNIIQASIM
jgi:hypothetical protein